MTTTANESFSQHLEIRRDNRPRFTEVTDVKHVKRLYAKLLKVERGIAYYEELGAIPIRDAFGKLADDPKWQPPKRLNIADCWKS